MTISDMDLVIAETGGNNVALNVSVNKAKEILACVTLFGSGTSIFIQSSVFWVFWEAAVELGFFSRGCGTSL